MPNDGTNVRPEKATPQLQPDWRRTGSGRPKPSGLSRPDHHHLSEGERLFEFGPGIAHSAVHLHVTRQELHRSPITCPAVCLRDLGPAHGMDTTSARLAVYGKVEERQFALRDLEMQPDGPDVFRFKWTLLAQDLVNVPGGTAGAYGRQAGSGHRDSSDPLRPPCPRLQAGTSFQHDQSAAKVSFKPPICLG